MSFETMIAEAVEAAVNCEAGKRREDTSREQKKTKGKGATQKKWAITGDLFATMVAALQPALVKSVTSAVTSAVAVASRQIMSELRHDMEEVKEMREEVESLRAWVQTQSFELDRLQQYSRRDNVRVYGIEETAEESSNSIMVKLASEMGVPITEQDISVSHRMGRKTTEAETDHRQVRKAGHQNQDDAGKEGVDNVCNV